VRVGLKGGPAENITLPEGIASLIFVGLKVVRQNHRYMGRERGRVAAGLRVLLLLRSTHPFRKKKVLKTGMRIFSRY
jgi:hypothetical protein